jgi:hypothetical protein
VMVVVVAMVARDNKTLKCQRHSVSECPKFIIVAYTHANCTTTRRKHH